MTEFENRLEGFLSNYTLYENCVNFRIASSAAIEQWKNVQAFQLNQLANGKFYFPKDRKEILLLKYDIWSKYIYEIEGLFIEIMNVSTDTRMNESGCAQLTSLAIAASDKLRDVIKNNPSVFDSRFSEIWMDIHQHATKLLIYNITRLKGLTFADAFSKLVSSLTKILQYTLIEIHELHSLFEHFDDSHDNFNVPFLILTDCDREYNKINRTHLVCQRFKTYMKHFQFSEVYFKNYANDRIPRQVFDNIEETGVVVRYKLNY